MMGEAPITLLWATRSPCNLSCEYCYFGAQESKSPALPLYPGHLSHNGARDAGLDSMLQFLETTVDGQIGRVFLAGGEPLLWPGWEQMVVALKAKNIEVVVCTNGIPLQSPETAASVIASGVDAVSVSLDSYDPEYNDRWRRDRSGTGWHGVVRGIQTVVRERDRLGAACRVGVYMVVTSLNIGHLVQTARIAEELGADYFVFQPVSLNPLHPLFDTLALTTSHHELFAGVVAKLFSSGLRLSLPNRKYVSLVLEVTATETLGSMPACFGGRDLFFIEPDGSVWDCPSWLKISKTDATRRTSIRNLSAREVFSDQRRGGCTDCDLFSVDCVNMWQLMAFDEILSSPRGKSR